MFLFGFLFYFLITCILMNMFFIFVNYEFMVTQKREEELFLLKTNTDHTKVAYKHVYWYVYEVVKWFFLSLWYSLTLRPRMINQLYEDDQQYERVMIREYLRTPQKFNFDMDFQRTSISGEDRKMVDAEKYRAMGKAKMELVLLIWKTILLVLLLSLNFILL
jgi:hypothetical protein